MKAYVYGANGAEIAEIAKPSPKGTQVLVKVHACGLNRADLGMTKGHVHGAAGGVGTVLGMEWAGEVAELGPEARGVKVGDKIMGSGGAAFAEYTLADHGRLFRAPSNMNFDEAATLPVALATMHNAVVTNGALQPGQTVLIQGASSGVGLMAMQIAKYKGAKTVIGSSTDAMRRGRLKEFGADLAVDSSDPGWVDEVLKATNGALNRIAAHDFDLHFLRRALRVLKDNVPALDSALSEQIFNVGISRAPFSIWGLKVAVEIFRLRWPFDAISVKNKRMLVDPDDEPKFRKSLQVLSRLTLCLMRNHRRNRTAV